MKNTKNKNTLLSRLKFDKKEAKNDLRKVAVSTFIIGIIGFVLPADKVPKYHGLLISLSATLTWIFALITVRPKKKAKKKPSK